MTIDPAGLTLQRLAQLVDAGAGSGGDVPVVNVLDYADVGDESCIQAALDHVASLGQAGLRTVVYVPPRLPGGWTLERPLRIKAGGVILRCHPQAVLGGNGHGPLMVVYPSYSQSGVPAFYYRDVQDNMGASLATGAGYAFDIGYEDSTTDPMIGEGFGSLSSHYLAPRPDTSVCEFNGLAACCIELRFQLHAPAISAASAGGLIGSTGALFGMPERTPSIDRAFFLEVTGSPLKVVAHLTVGVTDHTLTGTTTIAAANHHLALDYDGSKIRLFLDGVMEDSEAVTGTVTQQDWEHVELGYHHSYWPELGGYGYPASAYVDAVRLSKVSRYGSDSSFTPPATKWGTLDANTMLVLNFDEQFDAFTVGRTGLTPATPNVYLFLRRSAYSYAFDVRLERLFLTGQYIGSNTRSGLLCYATPGLVLRDFQIWGVMYGAHFQNNVYCSHLSDGHFMAFRGALNGPDLFPLNCGVAGGLMQLSSVHIDGGMYQLITCGGQVATNTFFNSSTRTKHNLVYSPFGGESHVELHSCSQSHEVGGDALVSVFLLGPGAQLRLFGGGTEHWAVPAIQNDCGEVVAVGWASHSLPDVGTGLHPYVMEVKMNRGLTPAPSTFVGCRRFLAQGGVAPQTRWADKPEHALVIGAGHRIKPVIEGGAFVPAGAVEIDSAERRFFVVTVKDAAAISIPAPLHSKPGKKVTIVVQNRSGGAMGVVTWAMAYNMAAWVNSGAGYQCSISFLYVGGEGWVETERSPVDVVVPDYEPADFAGLVAHWKADALGLSNNDPVTAWADETAENNDLAQATGAKQPIFKDAVINGLPAVLFDGTDDYLAGAASAGVDAIRTNRTVFIVAKATAEPTVGVGTQFLLNYGGSARWLRSFGQNFQESVCDTVLGWGPFVDTVGGVLVNNWYLLAVSFDHTSRVSAIYIDGLLIDHPDRGLQTQIAGVGGSPLLYVGGDGGADNFMTGYIAEIALYDAALDEDTCKQVEQYFARKYGLTIGEGFE